MIDEKKIQEAAAGMFNVGGLVNTVERMAFKRGVDWFKKALWHDTSETPEEGKQILYTATEGGEIVDVKVTTTALYDFIPWNEVVRDFNISKWCYIEDLLPEGGEK
jgi:hypothetical protein